METQLLSGLKCFCQNKDYKVHLQNNLVFSKNNKCWLQSKRLIIYSFLIQRFICTLLVRAIYHLANQKKFLVTFSYCVFQVRSQAYRLTNQESKKTFFFKAGFIPNPVLFSCLCPSWRIKLAQTSVATEIEIVSTYHMVGGKQHYGVCETHIICTANSSCWKIITFIDNLLNILKWNSHCFSQRDDLLPFLARTQTQRNTLFKSH